MKTPLQTIKYLNKKQNDIKKYCKGIIDWKENPWIVIQMDIYEETKKFIKNI